MYILDTPTRTYEILLAGAKQTTDSPWECTFEDVMVSRDALRGMQPATMGSQNGVTNGVTKVTVMAAQGQAGAGWTRQMRSFSMANSDSAPVSVTVQLNDNGTLRKVIGPIALDVNETLEYEEGNGWKAMDVAGSVKTTPDSGTSTASSKATSTAALASTASSAASLANTLAVSDGLAASVASSAASLADTKATSVGVADSTASSAASLANTKATSDGVAASVASSAASLADSKASNAQSRALSAGW